MQNPIVQWVSFNEGIVALAVLWGAGVSQCGHGPDRAGDSFRRRPECDWGVSGTGRARDQELFLFHHSVDFDGGRRWRLLFEIPQSGRRVSQIGSVRRRPPRISPNIFCRRSGSFLGRCGREATRAFRAGRPVVGWEPGINSVRAVVGKQPNGRV